MGGVGVADKINATGYSTAGFVNMSTSDNIVHGQVKQSGLFSFVRIYESGHEVPFYQPLASLEMLVRALAQKDLATGEQCVADITAFKTLGPATSTFREGNATIQLEVTPSNATYNTALNGPDPTPTWAPSVGVAKRSVERKRPTRFLGRPVKSKGGKRAV